MHKKILINFADGRFKKAQRYNSLTGKWIAGFHKVVEYSLSDIDETFKTNNKEIFSEKRGVGCWLWKPYIILKTLEKVDMGDYVMYSDAGAFFCGRVNKLLKQMEFHDIWVSDIPLIEEQWTKPYVFDFLCVPENVKKTPQIQASFVIVRKSETSMNFVKEWLSLCENPKLLLPFSTDESKGVCIEHREDQSILSVLSKIRDVKIGRDPTQFARFPQIYISKGRTYLATNHDDKTLPVIVHYRDPGIKKMILLKSWCLTWLPMFIVKKISK